MRHRRLAPRVRGFAAVVMAGVVAYVVAPRPLQASTTPAYIALGDSIEFGLGDDQPLDGIGYVQPFGEFLSSLLGASVETHDLGVPNATTRDIFLTQLRSALALVSTHQPVVLSWGGGGNDLGEVAPSAQANACRQSGSCLGRFNGLLNEAESAIDRTIGALRQAAGPDARILMRTQYNALAKPGCGTADEALLGTVVLEGAPGTPLERGLNDRIRSVAQRYHATVVELFVPFAISPDTLISSDCIHPSGTGYQTILALTEAAYVSGP